MGVATFFRGCCYMMTSSVPTSYRVLNLTPSVRCVLRLNIVCHWCRACSKPHRTVIKRKLTIKNLDFLTDQIRACSLKESGFSPEQDDPFWIPDLLLMKPERKMVSISSSRFAYLLDNILAGSYQTNTRLPPPRGANGAKSSEPEFSLSSVHAVHKPPRASMCKCSLWGLSQLLPKTTLSNLL